MVTAITYIYIYSDYSSNMEMLCVMLAVLTHLEEARHGAEMWFEPSLYWFFTLELNNSPPLPFSGYNEMYSPNNFIVILLIDILYLWIIFKWTFKNLNSETIPSPDTGQSVGHHTLSLSLGPSYPMGWDPGISFKSQR